MKKAKSVLSIIFFRNVIVIKKYKNYVYNKINKPFTSIQSVHAGNTAQPCQVLKENRVLTQNRLLKCTYFIG